MDTEKMMKERHELLTRLGDSLLEEMIACEIAEPQSEEEPEILTVLLDTFGDGEREVFLRGGQGTVFLCCSDTHG